jgi:hypothetical protein
MAHRTAILASGCYWGAQRAFIKESLLRGRRNGPVDLHVVPELVGSIEGHLPVLVREDLSEAV